MNSVSVSAILFIDCLRESNNLSKLKNKFFSHLCNLYFMFIHFVFKKKKEKKKIRTEIIKLMSNSPLILFFVCFQTPMDYSLFYFFIIHFDNVSIG